MNFNHPASDRVLWKKSFCWLAFAVVCFHAAYAAIKFPVTGLFIFGYAFGLVKLCDQPNVRRAFYFGLTTGYLCIAPQLFFLWHIFGFFAVVLWLVLAFWIGLFTATVCGCQRRWGKIKTLWLIPILWTGIEYFRSELYYLKFSWLNVGYALPGSAVAPLKNILGMGMYGDGFIVFSLVIASFIWRQIKPSPLRLLAVVLLALIYLGMIVPMPLKSKKPTALSLVGIQLEFPLQNQLLQFLTQALAKNTNAQIFVLSEYTLDGTVPDSLKNWCRDHSKFLVVGGKDFVTNHVYYNTAFVVGTNGDLVFSQAKRVPIQFFQDGLPAPKQTVWNSPWGKIGFCICYDLSYTLVTDELVRQGAQLLIVPTMDVEDWGRHQHELHSRIAPVRAAEYGVPIFRLASSGISQAVGGNGKVTAQTTLGGYGQILSAQLELPACGTLPLDRILAPVCTVATGTILSALVLLAWNNRRFKTKSSI